jgi:hypothetical protein
MWLLGAGASAAAGIPTAWDMIWEFKQRIYVSQKRVSLESVTDLGNPAIRAQLQSYFDASGTFPATGSPEEYANLFEAAWPRRSADLHQREDRGRKALVWAFCPSDVHARQAHKARLDD